MVAVTAMAAVKMIRCLEPPRSWQSAKTATTGAKPCSDDWTRNEAQSASAAATPQMPAAKRRELELGTTGRRAALQLSRAISVALRTLSQVESQGRPCTVDEGTTVQVESKTTANARTGATNQPDIFNRRITHERRCTPTTTTVRGRIHRTPANTRQNPAAAASMARVSTTDEPGYEPPLMRWFLP
jgi:hypothetical protein